MESIFNFAFLKHTENWKTLNKIKRIRSNLSKCPNNLEDLIEEDQSKWKMIILKLVNSKLNDMLNIQLEKGSQNKNRLEYDNFTIKINE
jgi:hypothetical protein